MSETLQQPSLERVTYVEVITLAGCLGATATTDAIAHNNREMATYGGEEGDAPSLANDSVRITSTNNDDKIWAIVMPVLGGGEGGSGDNAGGR